MLNNGDNDDDGQALRDGSVELERRSPIEIFTRSSDTFLLCSRYGPYA